MATLTRWDPFQELTVMRNLMDRLFNDDFSQARRWSEQGNLLNVPLDVTEKEDSYMIKASLPGINPEDVEITLDDNVLTLRGEMNQEDEQEGRYHVRERRYGSFMRSISLPSAIDRENVEASSENGILMIRLPKSVESKPRRISLNASKTIDGRASGTGQKGNGQSAPQAGATQQSGSNPGSGQSTARKGRGKSAAAGSNEAAPAQGSTAGVEGRENTRQ
jgi:HSP20 family protein